MITSIKIIVFSNKSNFKKKFKKSATKLRIIAPLIINKQQLEKLFLRLI